MKLTFFRVGTLLGAMLLGLSLAGAEATKRDAELSAPDGLKLKVTYYSAGKPGPGVLLMHQCNRDRKTWDPLATQLSQAGINVLTMDYRGFGESGGEPLNSQTPEQQAATLAKWPGDIDVAFQYLLDQPGIDKGHIGAGGASCGVNNSIQLALRHQEVKTLVLLSGNTDQAGLSYLEKSTALPLFVSASEDDGNTLEYMRWMIGFSRDPQDKLVPYKAAGHGTEMFKVEKGLEPMILEWFETTLRQDDRKQSAVKISKRSATAEFWDVLIQPGGAVRATKMFEEAKKKDPNVFLFPEQAVNVLGYERIQKGETKDAIAILKLNELAYPRSANVYDSLGDAYLADHQNDLALQYSQKALQVLKENPPQNEAVAKLVRDSAEGRIQKLQRP
ncbi:MAG: serine aminopeptidase domain-containing protein [Candidatus Acidiferrales bacterium]